MNINGVLVRAGSYPMLKVGHRYLFFVIRYQNALRFAGMFEVDAADRIDRVDQFTEQFDHELFMANPFDGMSLAEALRFVRARVTQ